MLGAIHNAAGRGDFDLAKFPPLRPLHASAPVVRMVPPSAVRVEESRMTRRAWPLAFAVVGVAVTAAPADNWPHWRGPTGDGVSREAALPLKWSERENVAWK